ncbi:YqaE/Pmp3 family membrane protein [Aspergillus aculeatinus CBS 121060]|uniref:UPF0057-domain-containing protein n=6 Tax=Aspergillus TaxID=5052 RepID=A0A319BVF8_9EURO|nr:UPF0057-domain-containing protein [Aspergillus uvarum CBS 121591]XP_025503229.1 UPF0057-domain-containing protein [Aspergillus aculeatinus CBS 121060]XP_040805534.1 UPF0057-domain-containing protein [Aspergillus fijiensis CBS 313.89]PYH76635.1 UPF0057-domain-containing protein [Aspergillus uvarum CBS 121591]RAH69406.1 UPF0057-domain-containing protein [Aspergillus aculeatinus CBS 121060]RAK81524.1 UPF0057-domain-containing protein [Aspergillus fijiensis CBS 313.89]
MPATASDVCLVILAIFIPPLAVLLKRGCGPDLCINIVLTLLGDIPGIIHALFIVLTSRDRRDWNQNQYYHQSRYY